MTRPYVILSAAMTLDGKIASKTGDSKISDESDLILVHKLRNEVDAIMIGINTVLVDDPILSVRYVERKRNPIRVIVDSLARTPIDSRIVKSAFEIETYLAISGIVDEERRSLLEGFGMKMIICGDKRGVNLKALLDTLGERGIESLMLEGGSALNWGMLSKGLVDEIRLTIAPIIVGGSDATSLVSGDGFLEIENGVRLKLRDVKKVGDFLRVHYDVKND